MRRAGCQWLLVAGLVMGLTATVQAGSFSFNEFMRRTGFGWSDGYHVGARQCGPASHSAWPYPAVRERLRPEVLPLGPAERSPSDQSLRRTRLAR